MFRQFLSICSVVCMALTMAASSFAEDSWALKMFDQSKFDFGPVAQHSDCQGYLEITNKFEPTMEVYKVSTSCKCITASTDTKVLAPQESGRIKLVLDTSHFSGQRNVTLTVTFRFDGSKFVTANIPCTAYIRTDVWLQPSFANFGSLSAGSGGEQRVKITRTGNESWRIQEVRSKNPNLSTELIELSRKNGKVEYEVLVKVSPEMTLGNIQESLLLVTNDSSNANVALRVDGKVEADVVATPDRLPLGKLNPGKEFRCNIVVKSKKPVRVEKIDFASFPDSFKATPSSDEKTVHVIPVVVTPPDAMGDLNETVTVTIAGRSQPLVIKATGTVVSLVTAGTP